jgi:hypothetical protein
MDTVQKHIYSNILMSVDMAVERKQNKTIFLSIKGVGNDRSNT